MTVEPLMECFGTWDDGVDTLCLVWVGGEFHGSVHGAGISQEC